MSQTRLCYDHNMKLHILLQILQVLQILAYLLLLGKKLKMTYTSTCFEKIIFWDITIYLRLIKAAVSPLLVKIYK